MGRLLNNLYPLLSERFVMSASKSATRQRKEQMTISIAKPDETSIGARTTGARAYPKNRELLNTDDAVPLSIGWARTIMVRRADQTKLVPVP